MDRVALVIAILFSLLLAMQGSLRAPLVFARKGYSARVGAVVGALAGFSGGVLSTLALLAVFPDRTFLAILGGLAGGTGVLVLLERLLPNRETAVTDLPEGEALKRNVEARHVRGAVSQGLYIVSIIVALVALATLIATIADKSFGLTAVQYEVEPEDLRILCVPIDGYIDDIFADSAFATTLANNTCGADHFLRQVMLRDTMKYGLGQTLKQGDKTAIRDRSRLTVSGIFDPGRGEYPAELAGIAFNHLTADQALELALMNLGRETLVDLVAVALGSDAVSPGLSDQELGDLLITNIDQSEMRMLVLRYLTTESDWSAAAGLPIGDLLPDATLPDGVERDLLLYQLSELQAAQILIANLDQADLETAVLNELTPPLGRTMDDVSVEELSALLAKSLETRRAFLLNVIVTDIVPKTPRTQKETAALLTQSVADALGDRAYPAAVADVAFKDLTGVQAADILARNLSADELQDLVLAKEVVESWSLWESLTDRDQIAAYAAEKYPDAELTWRSWVSKDFLTRQIVSRPYATGLRQALLGSLWIIMITIVVAFPIGVGAAIYLEEYAADTRLNRVIQTNINNLAGVPSIIYGMLGLAIFVRALEPFTSGQLFGTQSANGRTIISAGFTLALLVLPVIIINAQEAIRAVPGSLRQASFGLGATKWQTIWHHVLPNAMSGIMTGTILSISRAIGETAPLILIGGATFLTQDPDGPFSSFTALPLVIFRWTTLPDDQFRNAAAAGIVVLLALLLTLNSVAVILRNRFSRRLS